MAGDRVEVAADGLHVDRHVDGGLAAIDEHRHALVARAPADRGHIDHGAKDVRHVGHGDQLRLRPDRVNHRLRVEIAVRIDVDPFQHHALPFAQEVPGDDVGVMLHDRQHDLVARLQARGGPGVGDEVDRLGRAGGEDDLVLGARVQEARDDAAGGFVLLGREVRQVVQAPVDVGIFLGIGPSSPRRSPPAASAPKRRCRGRPRACRSPRARGSGNRRGSFRTSYIRKGLRPEDQDQRDAKDQAGPKRAEDHAQEHKARAR